MLDVQHWLSSGGLAVLAAVVFAESGLLLGFFLPGDTLLFIAGFLASSAGSVCSPLRFSPWSPPAARRPT